MDVEVAAGVEIPRTNGFARRAEWILGDLVFFFFLKILHVTVLSWNVFGDLFLVADFDAHGLGVEIWSEWCTRATHA